MESVCTPQCEFGCVGLKPLPLQPLPGWSSVVFGLDTEFLGIRNPRHPVAYLAINHGRTDLANVLTNHDLPYSTFHSCFRQLESFLLDTARFGLVGPLRSFFSSVHIWLVGNTVLRLVLGSTGQVSAYRFGGSVYCISRFLVMR